MVEVDRLMIGRYGVSVSKMMEYAGYQVANFIRRFDVKKVLVVCGKGNNGGDGLCVARHLHNRDYKVKVFVDADSLKEEPKNQLNILEKIGLEYFSDKEQLKKEIGQTELIVDALLGYNLAGNPKAPYDELIKLINQANVPIVSVDVPSGWDCEQGKAMQPCIRASHIVCLSFPRKGLDKYDGEVYLADIGLPKALWKDLGLDFGNIFKQEDIVKVK